MKFLFIVTSFWAFGELQIAIDFASRVSAIGCKVMFLIPPSHVDKVRAAHMPYRMLIPNSANLNRVLLHDIENIFTPSFIVLSDFINYAFCETHYGLTEGDLSVFSGVIGTFDLYDYILTGKRIDTYGFRAKEMSQLCIDKYDFLLQPCPVNPPVSDNSSKGFRYRIFDGITIRDEDDIKNARRRIGIKGSNKVIVMTGAVWQSSFKPYDKVKKMVSAVDDAIMQMILRLPQDYEVFWIGPRHKTLPENITKIHHIKSLPPAQFEMLVDSADVFLSANYISTSMVRAALRGVSVVLLGNSYLKREGESRSLKHNKNPDILKDVDTVYPFRMFPVGWYSFLEPIVNGNPFYKLVKCVEVFDTDEVLEAVQSAVSKNLECFQSYNKKWLELPSVETIVTSMKAITKTF